MSRGLNWDRYMAGRRRTLRKFIETTPCWFPDAVHKYKSMNAAPAGSTVAPIFRSNKDSQFILLHSSTQPVHSVSERFWADAFLFLGYVKFSVQFEIPLTKQSRLWCVVLQQQWLTSTNIERIKLRNSFRVFRNSDFVYTLCTTLTEE